MIVQTLKSIVFKNRSVYLVDVVADRVIIVEEEIGLKILSPDLETIKAYSIFKPVPVYSHPLEKSSVISVFKKENSSNILLYGYCDIRNEHFVCLNLKTLSYEIIPITCNLYEGISINDRSYVWELMEDLCTWQGDTLFFVDHHDKFYALSLKTRLTVPVEEQWVKDNLKDFYIIFSLYDKYGFVAKVLLKEKKFIYRIEKDKKYYVVSMDCMTEQQEVIYEGKFYWFRMEQSSRFWLFISDEAIEIVDRISGKVKIIYPEKRYYFSFSKFINENTFVSSQWRHCNPCTTILKTHSIQEGRSINL